MMYNKFDFKSGLYKGGNFMENKTKAKIVMSVGIVAIISVIVVLIVAIVNPCKVNEAKENYTFYNTGNVAEEGMEPINKEMNLGDLLQNVKSGEVAELKPVKNEIADKLLDLKEYKGLEKRVAIYESDTEYTEIWLFKISSEPQALDIFRMFNDRIEDLRKIYATKTAISLIVNNEKNISMKQQNGIVIIIVSNDAENVEKAIDEKFKSKYE